MTYVHLNTTYACTNAGKRIVSSKKNHDSIDGSGLCGSHFTQKNCGDDRRVAILSCTLIINIKHDKTFVKQATFE